MIRHTTPDDLKKWVRERRVETNARRLSQQEYAARCRSYDSGVQWLSRGGASPLDSAAIRIYKQAGSANVPDGGTAPLRTTLNKITENIRRVQAATNPKKLEVYSTPTAGIGRPTDVVAGDIAEAVANAAIESSGAIGVAKRANFERTIDGMHGFGFRIERSISPNGQPDLRLQCFNYDGYQLTLDPTNCDTNLYNHEYVILSEVITLHAAARRYGDDQVNLIGTDGLQEVGKLMAVESRYHSLTGGRLFPEMASTAKAKGLIVHTIFLKGHGKRFDRMYTIIDKGGNARSSGESMQVVNWAINQEPLGGNPYAGIGLPLFCLFGYPRSKDLHGISDVGMMIDSQDKLNIAASIYFQSLWNYVQKMIFVDRRSLDDTKSKASDVMRQMRQGLMFVNMRDKNSHFPQLMQMPQPPQTVARDIEVFKADVRDSGFRSAVQSGEIKSHVSEGVVERSLEQSALAAEDRVDTDIFEYEKFVEALTSTQIRLAQAGAPNAMRMMFESGLSDEQVGLLMRIDPMRQLPRLKLSEAAIRRRSRSQKKQDINILASAGVFSNDPTEMRRLLTELDMPVSEHDRVLKQYAEITAAKIAIGEEFSPFPMGAGAVYLIEALQRAASQTTDLAVRQRILQAMAMQQQAEQPPEQAEQQQPDDFQSIVDEAFNPNAAV